MRISAWSSDVCSSDLEALAQAVKTLGHGLAGVAGERLGAEIDLDAGDHAGPGDLLHERRAVGGLLADGLVVEDDAGDVLAGIGRGERSAERRVGKECVGTFSFRWSPYH